MVATLAFGGVLVRQAIADRRAAGLILTAAAAVVPIAGLLLANQFTTGDPLRFGYDVIWGTNHSLGFHTDPLGTAHTPARGLTSLIAALMQLNWSLFGWPVAGLLVVAAALLANRTIGEWEIVLLAWIELHLVAHSAYWSEGHFLGPRYLFTVVPALLILTARGIIVGIRQASLRVSRSLIAGFTAERDNCALLDAVVDEAHRPGAPRARLARLEQTKKYTSAGVAVMAPDPAFRVNDVQSITTSCWAEGLIDKTAGEAIAYGPALLHNEIGPDGRIAGRSFSPPI